MNKLYEVLYGILPVYYQNVICSLYGWNENRVRFGPTFYRYLNFLESSQYWGEKEIEEYKGKQFNKLVKKCIEEVPFYRSSLGGDLSVVFDDIDSLPVLTKEIVRLEKDKLLSPQYKPVGQARTVAITVDASNKRVIIIIKKSSAADIWSNL